MQIHFYAKNRKKLKKNLSNNFILVVKRKILAQCQQKNPNKEGNKKEIGRCLIFLKQWVCCCKKCLGSKEAAVVLWDKERSESFQQGCCVRGQSAASHLPQAGSGWAEMEPRSGRDAMSWLGVSFSILLVKALHWNNPSFCTLGMQEPKLF